MGQYLADLDKAGVLTGDKTPATLEGLKEVIAEAEDDLVTGNAEIAAVQLFKVIESPPTRSSTTRPNTRSPS